jgi:hypothetical protein
MHSKPSSCQLTPNTGFWAAIPHPASYVAGCSVVRIEELKHTVDVTYCTVTVIAPSNASVFHC